MGIIFGILFVIGLPAYVVQQWAAGTLDPTTGLGLAVLCVLIVAGIIVRWRQTQARIAEREFWIRQGCK